MVSFGRFGLSANDILNHFSDVVFYTNCSVGNFIRHIRFVHIDAGINCFWIFRCHLHKRIFYYSGCVESYTELQKQNVKVFVSADKFFITFCGGIPALILYKAVITSEIHCHRFIAVRASWDKLIGNFHIALLFHHCSNSIFIVKGFIAARLTALP